MIKEREVKKRQFAVLLGSIALVLALILSACGQAATPTTPTTPTSPTTTTTPSAPQVVTKEIEKVHKVLNPQGVYVPVQTVGLAPRLSTLAGKNILYYQSEANPVMMPVLLPRLQKDYPTATFKALYTESWGPGTPGDEIKGMDAVIRGVSW